MTEGTQEIKIKCPHCGWVRTVNVPVLVDESRASVVAGLEEIRSRAADLVSGLDEVRKSILAKMADLLADPELEEANAWIDMPKCPYCENVYRYNVRTGEVAK